jgi:hypothetical protein
VAGADAEITMAVGVESDPAPEEGEARA